MQRGIFSSASGSKLCLVSLYCLASVALTAVGVRTLNNPPLHPWDSATGGLQVSAGHWLLGEVAGGCCTMRARPGSWGKRLGFAGLVYANNRGVPMRALGREQCLAGRMAEWVGRMLTICFTRYLGCIAISLRKKWSVVGELRIRGAPLAAG